MNLKTTRVDVWSADIDDKPGGLARTLRAIADYGADLEYVMARRAPEKPGKGVLFVAPLKGREQLEKADQAGLRRSVETPTLRIEGTDEPAAGAKLAKAIAEAGVNMNALSAAVFGHRFVCYAAFDSAQELEKADAAIKALATTPPWRFWHRHAETKAA